MPARKASPTTKADKGPGRTFDGRRPKIKDDKGRPTKLTLRLEDMIVTLSSSLASDAAICRAVKIHPDTFVDWKGYARDGRQPYARLFERIDEAQAAEEIDLVSKIRADPDWRAKAWVLERRARGYENRQKHEHTGKDGKDLPAGTMPPVIVTIGHAPGMKPEDNPYAPPAPAPPPAKK